MGCWITFPYLKPTCHWSYEDPVSRAAHDPWLATLPPDGSGSGSGWPISEHTIAARSLISLSILLAPQRTKKPKYVPRLGQGNEYCGAKSSQKWNELAKGLFVFALKLFSAVELVKDDWLRALSDDPTNSSFDGRLPFAARAARDVWPSANSSRRCAAQNEMNEFECADADASGSAICSARVRSIFRTTARTERSSLTRCLNGGYLLVLAEGAGPFFLLSRLPLTSRQLQAPVQYQRYNYHLYERDGFAWS